jgi:Lon protease-like protein
MGRSLGRVSRTLPLFPLGTVLFPGTALPLHVFEPRYRALMDDLTGAELGTPIITPEFGITLIERGHEVGGGDARSTVGTVCRLADAQQLPDGRWVVVAGGVGRFAVAEWLPDDPYPQAVVEDLESPPWDPAGQADLERVEAGVRRTLELAERLGDLDGPVEFTLDDDPAVAAWQVCGVAPVGDLDRQRLLQAGDAIERLALLDGLVTEVADVLAHRLAGR